MHAFGKMVGMAALPFKPSAMWCVLQVDPTGLAKVAPGNVNGDLPEFASAEDYFRLLQIPGSRKGGPFFPDGAVLEPAAPFGP